MKGSQESLTTVVIKHGLPAPANPSTDGSRQGLWPTITANTPDMESNGPNGHSGTYLAGAVKAWATPRAEDSESCGMRHGRGVADTLTAQTRAWPTPTARDNKSGRGNSEREYSELTPMIERNNHGKLNPRWVETLMGLPVGWVMPSCKSPVTIEPTNSDSSATEWCPPPPTKHFSLSSKN